MEVRIGRELRLYVENGYQIVIEASNHERLLNSVADCFSYRRLVFAFNAAQTLVESVVFEEYFHRHCSSLCEK